MAKVLQITNAVIFRAVITILFVFSLITLLFVFWLTNNSKIHEIVIATQNQVAINTNKSIINIKYRHHSISNIPPLSLKKSLQSLLKNDASIYYAGDKALDLIYPLTINSINWSPPDLNEYPFMNFSNMDENELNYYKNIESNYYISIENVLLYGRHQFMFNGTMEYHQGGCKWQHSNRNNFLSIYNRSYNTNKIKYIENGILIAQFRGKAYYHYLIENYLRINIIFNILNDNIKKYTILTYQHPSNSINSETQFYSIYNFSDSLNIIHYEHFQQIYKIKNLIIPKSTDCGHVNKMSLIFWRNTFYKSFIKNYINHKYRNDKHRNDRIINILLHIRAPNKARSIANNDEIINVINHFIEHHNKNNTYYRQFEFNIFSYKNVSFDETIRKHYFANIIIGPHGAGLSNLIFTNFDSKNVVIEIHPKWYSIKQQYNRCFARIAFVLKKKYIPIVSKTGGIDGKPMILTSEKLIEALINASNFVISE